MKHFVALLMIVAVLVVSTNFCAAAEPLFFGKIVNCREAVSLRAEPDVYSECIVEIPLGTKIEVYSDSEINGFLHVGYRTFRRHCKGYVLSEYIKQMPWIECRDDLDFLTANLEAKVVNCREAVSLRYAPDVSAECIIEIPLGDEVKVANDNINGFFPVIYKSSFKYMGYILCEYIKFVQ